MLARNPTLVHIALSPAGVNIISDLLRKEIENTEPRHLYDEYSVMEFEKVCAAFDVEPPKPECRDCRMEISFHGFCPACALNNDRANAADARRE